MSTRNNTGKYIGISTEPSVLGGSGIWDRVTQPFYRRQNKWQSSKVVRATGGTKLQPGNGSIYHVFTAPGTFTLQNGATQKGSLLMVGAGGYGGSLGGIPNAFLGGGGAGGMIYVGGTFIISGSMDITVGTIGPGPGAGRSTTLTHFGGNLTAYGGGTGGVYPPNVGNPGGSGGGASAGNFAYGGSAIQTSNNGIFPGSGFGNPGGDGASPGQPNAVAQGGGGGGAGGAGGPGFNGNPNAGAGKPISEFAGPIISPAIPAPQVTSIGPTGLYCAGGYATEGATDFSSTRSYGSSGVPGIVIIKYPEV